MTSLKTARQIAASPAAIFAAIQDPSRLARWWGPNGFSNRFDRFEFKPGGKWVFSMIGPDGTSYANEAVFAAVATDHQVVIEHVSPPHFVLTITLTSSPGGTLVTWEQTFSDAAVAQALRPMCEPANEQNLDRLSAELGRAS